MIVHCLFEQSGTFKNAFKKYGIEAYDYDIQNEFNETDYVTDLFEEIDRGYQGEPSLFDKISPDDLIFAFFLALILNVKANYGFLAIIIHKEIGVWKRNAKVQ